MDMLLLEELRRQTSDQAVPQRMDPEREPYEPVRGAMIGAVLGAVLWVLILWLLFVVM